MNWDYYRDELIAGRSVSFRPKGNSMAPLIKSGQLVTVASGVATIRKGSIVFCKVNGKYYVHKVTAFKDGRAQISNNKGFVNGWANYNNVYGIVVKVED